MKEWSLVSCQVFSNLIRHYRRKFRAVKLAKGKRRFQKVLNKRVPLIVANVYLEKTLFHNDISPILNSYYPMKGLDFCDFFFK